MMELTWAELGTRLRAIGARLQQTTSKGDRVAILAPQGIDYIIGFFAAIKAGDIAAPLFASDYPPHSAIRRRR
jgi:acyl-CoA synthetase (AMP-forming)/AMP-acid ligase II